MAISWISVLKMVPWGEVISNAPKVADGAKKLWKTVGKKPEPAAQASSSAAEVSMADLQARLLAAEGTIAELHEQMLASSELINALAEQNAQLVQRVEVHRVRVKWLSILLAVAAGLAVTALWMALRVA